MDNNRILNINGFKYVFNSAFTIFELMDYLGFNKNVIVIDYNGVILDKNLWKNIIENKSKGTLAILPNPYLLSPAILGL